MPIDLNHTIFYVWDRRASAAFLADILGLTVGQPYGPFIEDPDTTWKSSFDRTAQAGDRRSCWPGRGTPLPRRRTQAGTEGRWVGAALGRPPSPGLERGGFGFSLRTRSWQ
jgi:hypothetical protein